EQMHLEATQMLDLSGESTLVESLCAAVRRLFEPTRVAVLLLDREPAATGPIQARLGAAWMAGDDAQAAGKVEVSSSLLRRVLRVTWGLRWSAESSPVASRGSPGASLGRSRSSPPTCAPSPPPPRG